MRTFFGKGFPRSRKNLFLFLLAFSSVAVHSGRADTPYDPTDDLLTAFGNQCSSSGYLTNTALAQSSTLKSIIASIRDDESCKSLIPLVNGIDTDLQASLQTHSDIDHVRGMVDDLDSAIRAEQAKGASADANYIAALSGERITQQATLLKVKQEVEHNVNKHSQQAARDFYSHSSALLNGLATNSACLNKHPNILAQAGAQILKLSADAFSGLSGAVLLATGGIIDHFVQFIRNYEINRDLHDVMLVRMSHALGCSFEGMAATYCRSRDMQFLLNANRDTQKPDSCDTVAQGTNLLSRDLNSFYDFVSTIYAGSKASSSATAMEKIKVIELRSGLQSLRVTVDGEISNYEKNYNSSQNPADKENTVRNLIRALANDVTMRMNNSQKSPYGGTLTTTGPVGDTFSQDPSCGVITFYYSQGKEKACFTNTGDAASATPCEACFLRTHPGQGLPSMSEIKETSKIIMNFGDEYVARQSALYNQNNPQLALTAAEIYGQNRKRALDFLYDARTYLQHLLTDTDGIAQGQMLKTIQLSLNRILEVITTIESSALNPEAKPDEVAQALSNILAPSSDTYYIPREISTIVRQDIDLKLAKGKIDKNLALILQLSTSDSLSELLNAYGSLEALRNQIRGAKRLTKANLNSMGMVFSENIGQILKTMKENSAGEDAADAKDDMNLFCIQLLLIPSAPFLDGNDLSQYCKDAVYQGLYSSLKPLAFNELAQRSYEERACSVYDFYRKARLNGIGIKSQ